MSLEKMLDEPSNVLKRVIETYIPDENKKEAAMKDMKKSYLLKLKVEKHNLPKNEKKRLTAKMKRQMGLFKIDSTNKTYSQYKPLNELWKQYMRNVLEVRNPSMNNYQGEKWDPRHEQVAMKVSKADLHGCSLTIQASKCPSYVGTEGIVLQETRHTFVIITIENQVKTIPKAHSEFTFKLDGFTIHIYGNHFRLRPGERISKRMKQKPTIDL